jgi:hypothetical protein
MTFTAVVDDLYAHGVITTERAADMCRHARNKHQQIRALHGVILEIWARVDDSARRVVDKVQEEQTSG